MNTSKIIKSFRGKKLLTQEEMANKLNISRQMYNIYEKNVFNLELNTVVKILQALDVNNIEFQEFLNALKQDYMSYDK